MVQSEKIKAVKKEQFWREHTLTHTQTQTQTDTHTIRSARQTCQTKSAHSMQCINRLDWRRRILVQTSAELRPAELRLC